ncbi:MAG: type III-B CRISPR-associated protein Cas10/Cmr2, partial [Treponema sp.]|nr:type III-B CRISPR-associated protein Cas10/Cmr2 [Treponema sp.]
MKSPSYWQDKIAVWLHDPVCKLFDIPRHEEMAKEIADTLFQSAPDKGVYQMADMIASSLVRAAVPGYSADATQNGAINFIDAPIITHPLAPGFLRLKLPQVNATQLLADIKSRLIEDLGLDKKYEDMKGLPENAKPLNGFFDRDTMQEDWAKALYHYLFFAFQRSLRNNNTGGLGVFWDVLPADTRIPDNSLWHHLGLTSALASSGKEVAMVVFSITPVQDFIANARKLRDYWTGSVLLSYLAFTGIREVMNEYGPDHILYPSLHNQSLVNDWLEQQFHLGRLLREKNEDLRQLEEDAVSIAAFPNKFVFICPHEGAADFCKRVEETINAEWKKQAGFARDFLAAKTNAGNQFAALWSNQIDSYWKYSWAVTKLAALDDKNTIAELLPKEKWEQDYNTMLAFAAAYSDKGTATARLYGATHSLAQGVLAAGKMKPSKFKTIQESEKCPLCGEHEVLHDFDAAGKTAAKAYRAGIKQFWDKVRTKTNPEEDNFSQTGKTERLCAVCAVKRYLPVAIRRRGDKQDMLRSVLDDSKFPSTTEIAGDDFLNRLWEKGLISSDGQRKKIIEELHQQEVEVDEEEASEIRKQGIPYTNKDKYYALLLMDGDKMGDLINGSTIAASWGDVLHPELVKRFDDTQYCAGSPFRKAVRLSSKRTMNPALHAMISDSLNNFARYGVNPEVAKGHGRLIYAGGDDVCAILPLASAIKTADAIRKAYTMSFASYTKTGASEIGEGGEELFKIGMHLGHGEKISISGAIVIAHHKQPLREVIRSAHDVLDGIAKKQAG